MSNKGKITFILVNAVVTVLLLSLFYNFNRNSMEKSVYIDTGKLLSNYTGMITAKKAFETKAKLWQMNVDTLLSELEGGIKKYEKERSGMSDKEKKLNEELLVHKREQYLQYKEAMQKKAVEEEQKLNGDVISKVNEFIKNYGKEHHYKIIFGTNSGNILYAEDTMDITQEVLDGLNKTGIK